MYRARLKARMAFFLTMVLALTGIAHAKAPPQPEQAAEIIRSTFDQATAELRTQREQLAADPGTAKRLMQELLGPHVDFPLLSRLVLGPHWRTATPAQRQRFVDAFANSLFGTYAALLSDEVDRVVALLDLGDELMEIKPVLPGEDPRRVTVRTVLRLGERPVAIDYRMRASADGWKVYDIVIEGVSFAASRRSEIGGLLQRQSLDQLIAQLESR